MDTTPTIDELRARRDDDSWLRRPPSKRVGTLRVEGAVPDRFAVRVGVVGSRKVAERDVRMARVLTRGLVAGGAWVFSGGAAGVDVVAHQTALEHGGRTVAMLPAGLGRPYPPRHASIYRQAVTTGGGVAAFVGDDEDVARHRFLQRNAWLVAALDALIVVAAGKRSGSMHCAREAWRAGVPIWTVPWGLDRADRGGCLELLRCGARAVWTEEQTHELARQFAAQPPSRWLAREPELPTIKRQTRGNTPAHGEGDVDGPGKPRQGCTPAAGVGGDPSPLQDGDRTPDTAWGAALRAARRPMTVEEVAAASGLGRVEVGAALLEAALGGAVRRRPDGRYEAA